MKYAFTWQLPSSKKSNQKPVELFTPGATPADEPTINGAECVIPVNGMGHALFRDIKVQLMETTIASRNGMYAYVSDFKSRLFQSKSNKDNTAQMEGQDWEEDAFEKFCTTADHMKKKKGA